MMIKLIDRDGDTVKMSAEDIARSLRMMGNPPKAYALIPYSWDDARGFEPSVLQLHSCVMPRYSWLQLLRKRWRWERAEKKRIAELKKADNVGLIIEPRPFVLEKPWLRLKGNKAVTIYVD